MIKNVIFDIGKVLTNVDFLRSIRQYTESEDQAVRCYEALCKNDTWGLFDKGTYTTEEVTKRIVDNDPEMEKYSRAFIRGMDDLLFPFAFTDAWIDSVKNDQKKVYILSNWPEHVHHRFKKEMGFLNKVDGYLLSYQEKLVKPEYAFYQLLLERYQIKAQESVFVDDRKENIVAAEEVGIKGILFETKEQVEKELKELGVNIRS